MTCDSQPELTAARAHRPLCQRCQRPLRTCLCHWLQATSNRIAVLVLQHPAETHHAKGSARLLSLSLLNCRCVVGEQFDAPALAQWLGEGSVLLYPATSSPAPAPELAESATTVKQLVVLDGTWRQSRQLLRLNPALQTLPRVSLSSPPPSRYGLRQAQRPDQRSTLEATCLALGTLEAQAAHYTPLLHAFAAWVQAMQAISSSAKSALPHLR